MRPPALSRGPRAKAQCSAGRRPGEARGPRQRGEPGVAAARRDLEALGHERPIEPGERHHVADRAERHEVEPAAQVRLGPAGEVAAGAQGAVQRDRQQEGHADRGQLADRALPGRADWG